MKVILAIVLAMTCCMARADDTNKTAVTDEQLGDKLMQAIVLGRVGLYDEAEAMCKEILAQKPDQPTVKELLRELEDLRHKREAKDPGYALRRNLEQILVPVVSFRQAAPADVLDFLSSEAKKLAPDKAAINFVWLVPADIKLNPVTLNLKNVPFIDVLNYFTQLAGLRYRIDAHAVVIYKPEPEKPIPPASEPFHVKPQ
jgi:hypothetical protein